MHRYINRYNRYHICNKKVKILCVIQYKCNVFMNSQLACINTNSTLLGTSPSTCVKGTDSTKNLDVKAARETDTTSGKKKLYKNFIYNEFTLTYPSAYINRNWKEMSKNIILTYSDI